MTKDKENVKTKTVLRLYTDLTVDAGGTRFTTMFSGRSLTSWDSGPPVLTIHAGRGGLPRGSLAAGNTRLAGRLDWGLFRGDVTQIAQA